ncbi:MAG: N(2)-fixation sustaining protein CowN [Arcobacteraceae bacterium]|nr:N(2)-fixation sustaining protein CowN [Arcobacteraceae bacterium]MDY0326657.1 N(2)-fixation sustaining protein CowN [Arcobacteraceae bacterium]
MIQEKDRYITFENIDCYKNAIDVLDAMNELFEMIPESKNDFWVRFMGFIPENYKDIFSKEGDNKDILYHVCGNIFYIWDLFDEYDFEKGQEILNCAEMECC